MATETKTLKNGNIMEVTSNVGTLSLETINPGFDNDEEYELWWWLFVLLGEMQFPNSFSEYGYKVSLFNKSDKPLIYTYKGKEKR